MTPGSGGVPVRRKLLGCTAFLLAALSLTHAASGQAIITIDTTKPGHRISPTLWGVFFEDISHAADGGLDPELVRNGSFEDAAKPEGWVFADLAGRSAAVSIDETQPLNPFNRRSLRVRVDGPFSLENQGYWGMNVVAGNGYTFRAAARASAGFQAPVTVKILSATGRELASGTLSGIGGGWQYHSLELVARGTDPRAKLQLCAGGHGELFLDMVSLLPKKTWKGHGLRVDLAESLHGLHPSFLRFPGGCWVEGEDLAHMNHWKQTVGNRDTRPSLGNLWGYHATQGLGYYEFLQLAEDLGAAPLFDINAGMSHREVVPPDRMGQWVQDALDALEYANGPTNSVWGSCRAAAGHPASFKLKYLEIGNENAGRAYQQRWTLLAKALRQKYPEVRLVANVWQGGYPTEPPPDLIDEHYYESTESFMKHASQYDSYDRHGPKVLVGEYAVAQGCGQGNLRAAVGEAAFMTGLERNSDVVAMACYAPLFANLNHRAWNPDLINFDSSRWYGIPSYYVQQMFSQNRGDFTLPVRVTAPPAQTDLGKGMIGVGTWNTQAEFKDLKVTGPDGRVLFAPDFSASTEGWQLLGAGQWKVEAGALRQTAQKEFVRALAGDSRWTDYTFSLKARKLAGEEGFLILFRIKDPDNRSWWNLGGWKNTQDAIESDGTQDPKPGQIETGRWYDLRVEVSGRRVKCYLDGALVHDVLCGPSENLASVYACASRQESSGELIVKVVNVNSTPQTLRLDLAGATNLAGQATALVLTSGSPKDENSLAEPTKVFPRSESLSFQGQSLERALPGNSLTIMRIK